MEYEKLTGKGEAETSAMVRPRALSARAFHRVLKLARTIADLAGAERIAAPPHCRASAMGGEKGPSKRGHTIPEYGQRYHELLAQERPLSRCIASRRRWLA